MIILNLKESWYWSSSLQKKMLPEAEPQLAPESNCHCIVSLLKSNKKTSEKQQKNFWKATKNFLKGKKKSRWWWPRSQSQCHSFHGHSVKFVKGLVSKHWHWNPSVLSSLSQAPCRLHRHHHDSDDHHQCEDDCDGDNDGNVDESQLWSRPRELALISATIAC